MGEVKTYVFYSLHSYNNGEGVWEEQDVFYNY
jgi:hypothetical protein